MGLRRKRNRRRMLDSQKFPQDPVCISTVFYGDEGKYEINWDTFKYEIDSVLSEATFVDSWYCLGLDVLSRVVFVTKWGDWDLVPL